MNFENRYLCKYCNQNLPFYEKTHRKYHHKYWNDVWRARMLSRYHSAIVALSRDTPPLSTLDGCSRW